MNRQINNHSGFAAAIAADCLSRYNATGEQLYHYTSAQSLLGIIASKELWLSEHSYLNDFSEVTDGLTTLLGLLKTKKGIEYIDLVHSSIEQDIQLAMIGKLFYHTFVFSFSEDNDSKSQWSEYGDDYKGVCLGFDHKMILDEVLHREYAINYESTTLAMDYTERGLFSKVIYDDSHKKELLEAIIDKSIEVAKELPETSLGSNALKVSKYTEIFNEALYVILKLLPLFKNSQFASEKEHRIVLQYPIRAMQNIVANLDHLDYRVINGVIRPYYRLRFDSLDQIMKSVRIGPLYNDDKSIFTVEEVLNKMGINNTTVDVSTIPIQ